MTSSTVMISSRALSSPSTTSFSAASALQRLLPELVALTLHSKQAHWNLTGPGFLPLHALTDDLATASRDWADRVAERAIALGFTADARPGTVAAVGGEFPGGPVSDREVITELGELIDAVASTTRAGLAETEEADAVAHDIHVQVLEGLEKFRWFLRAQGT
jgi:starvation-inducible DNA-binding protein